MTFMRYWQPSIPSRIRGDCPSSGTTSDASNGPSLDKSGPIASGTPPAGITGEVNGLVLVAVTVSGVTAAYWCPDQSAKRLTYPFGAHGAPATTVGNSPP